MTGPRNSEPVTDPLGRQRGYSELIGVVMVLAALTGLAHEMFGHGHNRGVPVEQWRFWTLIGIALFGMYLVNPRRTEGFVTLVSTLPGKFAVLIPGRRAGDPPGAPVSYAPPVVVASAPAVMVPAVTTEAARAEINQPPSATAASAHTFDPGA